LPRFDISDRRRRSSALSLALERRRIASPKTQDYVELCLCNYSRDLRAAKWDETTNLRCKNVEPPMSQMGH